MKLSKPVIQKIIIVFIALVVITYAANAAEFKGTMFDHVTGSKVWLLEHNGVVFKCWPYVNSKGHVICADPNGNTREFKKVHETEGYIVDAD